MVLTYGTGSLPLILRSVRANERVHISRLGKANFVFPFIPSEGIIA